MKGKPTGGTSGNGPKWKGQTWSSMGSSYERQTAVPRKKAAAAKSPAAKKAKKIYKKMVNKNGR